MGLGYAEDRFFSTEVRRGGVIIELIRTWAFAIFPKGVLSKTGIHRTQMQSDDERFRLTWWSGNV